MELRCCPRTLEIVPNGRVATEQDFRTEYLELILSVKIVDDVDAAMIAFLNGCFALMPGTARAAVRDIVADPPTERATADALGISVGTVKSTTHLALRRMRESLKTRAESRESLIKQRIAELTGERDNAF